MNTALSLGHALRVKSAEFWLTLGEPKQAVRELQRLPGRVRKHPWVMKTRVAVARALRELNQYATSF